MKTNYSQHPIIRILTLAITYVVLPTIFAGLVWVLIYVVVLAIVSLLIS